MDDDHEDEGPPARKQIKEIEEIEIFENFLIEEKVRLEELEKKYKELKCVTLKLLTNTFTQPEFYLQAQQNSAVIEELHVDLITSNSLMLLSSPHKRQLISPARPIVPCPISSRIESAYYVKISKKKLKIYEKSHSMVTSIKEMLRKKDSLAVITHRDCLPQQWLTRQVFLSLLQKFLSLPVFVLSCTTLI